MGDRLTLARQSENGLPSNSCQVERGLTSATPDTRITNVNSLPPGPFQLTNDSAFTWNSYAASPVFRRSRVMGSHAPGRASQTRAKLPLNASPGHFLPL
jgi:hypothetical protein